MNATYDFGMVGLGVMGQNLLLNIADNGFAAIGFDLNSEKTTALEAAATPGTMVKGVNSLAEMVQVLKVPRTVMLLVPAGKPVDDVINSLLPLLQPGDIIIDGGNSFYTDTIRRVTQVAPTGIHFMGMGVSGGEEGARRGPALMPGGDENAYQHIQPILQAIAAKVHGNEPCVAYMGKDGAGHYVKMVHNGIEYAIMQLISEVYDILKRGTGASNEQMHAYFNEWNNGKLKSYLIEITAAIFKQSDTLTNAALLDVILDKAGSKGTGKWTSQDAMNHGVAIPVIDAAVALRTISSYKTQRTQAAQLYPSRVGKVHLTVNEIADALFAAIILCYAQGLSLIATASEQLNMQVPLHDAVKVWRGGCIIRSTLLEDFYQAYQRNPMLQNILLDAPLAAQLQAHIPALRKVIAEAITAGIPVMGLYNALGYFDNYTLERMPTNMIQAQRDYFGAHTYQRTDRDGIFHTQWS
ncbi:MAG TPA: phosphogluconate dehydrogenase (NADP(+)-dependent, decarboxylating) [Chitinophagaceae bacterium]|nr:phosphogluconate dehydrogenase (NADP(+)-dependent, decarboxylating) [Chitinophagaceae bacterium]